MPDPAEILAGLSLIANRYVVVAVGFHVGIAALAVAAWRGWRPSNHLMAGLLVLPLVPVAAFAAVTGNPFNASVFTALVLALALVARRLGSGAVRRGPVWSTVVGLVMVVFGAVYPHFVAAASVLTYLYAAPIGLVPCPTLSFVIGSTLILDRMGSRVWSLILAFAGLFYGVFGLLRLGVWMDTVLILGAGALLAVTIPELAGRRHVRPRAV
jgi:hypothetical protein